MITAAAVIPTIGASALLPDLCDALLRGGVSQVWLVDNFDEWRQREHSDTDRLAEAAAKSGVTYERVNQSIYVTWNRAMDRAVQRGVHVLHVLNDDIELHPLDVHRMTTTVASGDWAIVGYDYLDRTPAPPHQATGSFRKHGVPGFAFAVNPLMCARVDERFRWWGGDDDLFNRTEHNGHQLAVLPGAHVNHPHPSTSAYKYPLEQPWHDEDRALLTELWGDAW